MLRQGTSTTATSSWHTPSRPSARPPAHQQRGCQLHHTHALVYSHTNTQTYQHRAKRASTHARASWGLQGHTKDGQFVPEAWWFGGGGDLTPSILYGPPGTLPLQWEPWTLREGSPKPRLRFLRRSSALGLCACVLACVRVRARACACACVRVRVRVRVSASLWGGLCESVQRNLRERSRKYRLP